jgi:SET domain-containing protein
MYKNRKPKIEVRKSNIHNRGVFANEYIKNGDIIEEVHLISYIPAEELSDGILCDIVLKLPEEYNNENLSNYSVMLGYGSIYNHSDKNNAVYRHLNDQILHIVAIKDIYPDQEICVDYGIDYWTSRSLKNKN